MSIHFIGIGGIGVSALAKYYLSAGVKISGSDLKSSEMVAELKRMGAKIYLGAHRAGNVPKAADLVIYTSAVPSDNPERKEAHKRRLKTQSYAEAVGELTKKYKTVTISGSHGKSTTTALAALVLMEGSFDPTVIIGTKMKEFALPLPAGGDGSNFHKGLGPHLLLEADEWNKSFLNYHPTVAIITNIDAEHLDTYKNQKDVEETFQKYLERVPKDGKIIANADDPSLKRIAKKYGKKVIWYSLKDKEAKRISKILKVPGEHNVSNALAALALGRLLGITEADILRALSKFEGTWRRFEFKGMLNGAFIYTDYGHHPTEIKATLKAARGRFPFRRLWCVYQPHQYQRLAYLWSDFIGSFDLADVVCFLPVYDVAGRETGRDRALSEEVLSPAGRMCAREKVDSEKLAREVERRGKKTHFLRDQKETVKFIRTNARKGDVIFIMGAGDIYDIFTEDFLDKR